MIQPIYKKGHVLVWIGFLGGAFFKILIYFVDLNQDVLGSLLPFTPLFNLLSIVALAILIYGCYLVLKSKNRSQAWLLLLILNVIGLLVIFWLKDKSTEDTLTTDSQ